MTTDGEKSSERPRTAEERQSNLDAVLAHYEKNLGLRDNVPPHEADEFMHMDRAALKQLSAEDCNEGYYILQRYAMYLQREVNKEQSHLTWADSTLNLAIVEECGQYKGSNYTPYEERRLLAIRGNEFARKLERLRMNAQLRIDRLSYIAADVHKIANALLEIKQTKGKYGKD